MWQKFIFIVSSISALFVLQIARGQDKLLGGSVTGVESSNTNRSSSATATNSAPVITTTNFPNGALVGFDTLAGFPLILNDDLQFTTNHAATANSQVNSMIPTNIKALDHRNLCVEGYMVPIQFEKDKAVDFMLVQAPFGCCYGTPPQIHELIVVHVKSPGVDPIMDGPARVRGTFHVGAERQDGSLSSIYRLDAESVEKAPEK